MINRVIFALSLLGVCVSAYLLYTYLTQSPISCLDGGCEIVRKSKYSSIIGVPVPAIGIIGYVVIALITMLRTHDKRKELLWILLSVNTIGMLFSLWFTYAEIFLIKALCTWCVISALLMTGIFVLSWIDFRAFGKR